MPRGTISDWLIYCADPLGPRGAPPRHMLEAARLREFVERAEYHGILAAVFQNFSSFSPTSDPENSDAFTDARRIARDRHRSQRAFALMLQTQADALMADADGIPATIVKGPVFARTIYPEPWYRPFSDIDILVAPDGLTRLESILLDRGFRPYGASDPTGQCRSWVNDKLRPTLFELHLNLVNSNEKWHCSLRYEDIAEGPQQPAAMLMTAIIHGGATHRFLRLQHVIDVCQAARHVVDAGEEMAFMSLVEKTNARTLAHASLLLVGRIAAEPKCLALAAAFGWDALASLAARSLARMALTGAKDEHRPFVRLQQKLFREFIGRGDPL